MNNETHDVEIIEFIFSALKERHLTHLTKICGSFFDTKFGLSISIFITGMAGGDHKFRKKYILFNAADIHKVDFTLEENHIIVEYFKNNDQPLLLEKTNDTALRNALAGLNFDIAVPLNNKKDQGSLPEFVGILLGKINNSSLYSSDRTLELCTYISKHLPAAFANAIYFHLNNELIEQQKQALRELRS
jgi:hypothetical protein